MNAPEVSVIMPAHNASSTLAEAVRSVLAQSLLNIELIVCDDASTDESAEIASTFRDARVRIIRNKVNRGPGPSRDLAMRHARAPWIAFIDADDAWHELRLERLRTAAGSLEDVIVFDDVMICHDSNGILAPWRRVHGKAAFKGHGSTARLIDLRNYITSRRLLMQPLFPSRYTRELGLKHSSRRFGEDAEFILGMAAAGARLMYLPEALYFYRLTPGSLTATAQDVTAMRRCLQACQSAHDWPPVIRSAFDEKIGALKRDEHAYAFVGHLRQGELRSSLRLLLNEPSLVASASSRVFSRTWYHLHRLLHGIAAR